LFYVRILVVLYDFASQCNIIRLLFFSAKNLFLSIPASTCASAIKNALKFENFEQF